jgi:hypothetical protein
MEVKALNTYRATDTLSPRANPPRQRQGAHLTQVKTLKGKRGRSPETLRGLPGRCHPLRSAYFW